MVAHSLPFVKFSNGIYSGSNRSEPLDLWSTVFERGDGRESGGRTRGPPRESVTHYLAERWWWPAARREVARLARRLDRHAGVEGVSPWMQGPCGRTAARAGGRWGASRGGGPPVCRIQVAEPGLAHTRDQVIVVPAGGDGH